MRSVGMAALAFLLSPLAFSQMSDPNLSGPAAPQQPSATQTQQPTTYPNYSIMLVSPTGGAVVLMHNPKGELQYVDVNNTKQAFAAGYVPARVSEIAELIGSLKEEIDRLTAENARIRTELVKMQPDAQTNSIPSQAQIEAQLRAQAEAEKAARRQQLLQTWMMLQNMNRPQTQNLNVNVTDCTRFPALCVGR
jgi:regulator of replication initiation timing